MLLNTGRVSGLVVYNYFKAFVCVCVCGGIREDRTAKLFGVNNRGQEGGGLTSIWRETGGVPTGLTAGLTCYPGLQPGVSCQERSYWHGTLHASSKLARESFHLLLAQVRYEGQSHEAQRQIHCTGTAASTMPRCKLQIPTLEPARYVGWMKALILVYLV